MGVDSGIDSRSGTDYGGNDGKLGEDVSLGRICLYDAQHEGRASAWGCLLRSIGGTSLDLGVLVLDSAVLRSCVEYRHPSSSANSVLGVAFCLHAWGASAAGARAIPEICRVVIAWFCG